MKFATRSVYAIVVALLSFAAGASNDGIRLPDIGDSSGAVITQADEEAYGQALMREFRRLAHIIDDPLIEDYIDHLGYSLVSFSDEPERDFHFFVVDDDNVNAFAAPGGYIGMHTGLMLKADNESEVAAVMAHEVAHVTQRHLARAVESAQKMTLPMTLLMLGALLASGGDGDAVQTAVIGSQALMAQMQINFTRANEYEADRLGIHTLSKAGYDPAGMASFFGKMQRLSRGAGVQVPEFLRTHPVETSRIAEAKDRAESMSPIDQDRRDPGYFLLIKERTRVLTADRPEDLLRYYIDNGADELHEAYGLALAQLALGDAVAAAETINPHLSLGTNSIPLELLKAELAFSFDGSRKPFEELSDLYPENRPISLRYAELLLEESEDKSARKAERLLRPLLTRYAEDAKLHLVYSQAADRSGMPIRASEAYAQHVYLQGRVYDAVTQLRKVLDTPGLDYYARARVEARLMELEPVLAEIERENGWDPSEGRSTGRRRIGSNTRLTLQ